jgi:hypothetical protein
VERLPVAARAAVLVGDKSRTRVDMRYFGSRRLTPAFLFTAASEFFFRSTYFLPNAVVICNMFECKTGNGTAGPRDMDVRCVCIEILRASL